MGHPSCDFAPDLLRAPLRVTFGQLGEEHGAHRLPDPEDDGKTLRRCLAAQHLGHGLVNGLDLAGIEPHCVLPFPGIRKMVGTPISGSGITRSRINLTGSGS